MRVGGYYVPCTYIMYDAPCLCVSYYPNHFFHMQYVNRYLQKHDSIVYEKANTVFKKCNDKKMEGHPIAKVVKTLMVELRDTVGEVHWKAVCSIVDTLLKQKEQKVQAEYQKLKSMKKSLGAMKRKKHTG